MKRIMIIAFLLCSYFGGAQVIGADLVNFTVKSEAQMNAITVGQGLQEGSILYREDTDSLWRYNGSTWAEMTGGSATTDASDLTSGVLADGRVQESNVTQHEAALTITESQISDLGSYLPLSGGTMIGNINANENQINNILQATFTNGLVNMQQYFRSSTAFEISFDGTVTNALNWNYGSGEWRIGANRILTTADGAGSGDLWSDEVDSDILVDTDATYDLGNATSQFNISHFERYTTPNISNDAWWIMDGSSGDHFGLDYSATPSTAFSPLYTFHNTGTPTNSTDVATKAYVDANSGSGDSWSDPVDSDIVPDVDNTRDLGSPTTSFSQAYINNISFNVTDTEPSSTEGYMYSDLSEGRLRYHDGSSYRALAFEDEIGSGSGDVTAASNFGTDNVLIRSDGTGKGVQSSGITISDTDLVTFPGGTYYSAGNMNLGDSRFYMGEDEGVSGRRWSVEKSQATEKYVFSYQQSDQTTSTGGTYTAFYTLDESGTPSGSTDLIPKSYADANYDDQTAAEVTSSATGNIAATNVDDAIAELESEKLASISASRTNEETYSNVIGQPYDDSVSDGAPPAGTLILEYEVPPAILGTGTTADMDDYMGYNTGTAGSGTSYTIQNVVEGGFSYFYVNAASEPTVSGTGITVEKFPNTTAFINNEDMYMCVWAVTDTLVHYWFVEKQ